MTVLRFFILICIFAGPRPALAFDGCRDIFSHRSKRVEPAATRAKKLAYWNDALASQEFRIYIDIPVDGAGYWMYELQAANGHHVASVEIDFESDTLISIAWQVTEAAYRQIGAQTVLARRIAADFPKVRTLTSSLKETNLELMLSAIRSGASDVDAFKTTAVYNAYAEAGFSVVDKISRYNREDGKITYTFFLSKPL